MYPQLMRTGTVSRLFPLTALWFCAALSSANNVLTNVYLKTASNNSFSAPNGGNEFSYSELGHANAAGNAFVLWREGRLRSYSLLYVGASQIGFLDPVVQASSGSNFAVYGTGIVESNILPLGTPVQIDIRLFGPTSTRRTVAPGIYSNAGVSMTLTVTAPGKFFQQTVQRDAAHAPTSSPPIRFSTHVGESISISLIGNLVCSADVPQGSPYGATVDASTDMAIFASCSPNVAWLRDTQGFVYPHFMPAELLP